MKNDIRNLNHKGQLHGYQEWYRTNGKLWSKFFYNNGTLIYYEEWYWGCELEKNFYI